MNRVIIGIADQTIVRDLRTHLDDLGLDLDIARVCDTTTETVAAVAAHRPAVLFVHDTLEPGPVSAAIRDLVLRQPALAVLMVSTQAGPEVYASALDSGARGVLTYPFSHEDIASRVTSSLEWGEHMRSAFTQGGGARTDGTAATKLIVATGAKGGVGTTVFATHLAWDMATQASNVRVCLVDLDLTKGDVPSYLDVAHRVSVADLAKIAEDLNERSITDTVAVHSSGLHLLLTPTEIRDTDFVTPQSVRQLLASLRNMYDVVIVDAGAAVTTTQAAAVEMADDVLQLVTPDVPALRAARRQVLAWQSLGVREPEDVTVVVNRYSKRVEIQQDTIDHLVLGRRCEVLLPDLERRLERSINSRTPSEVQDKQWWAAMRGIGGELDVLVAYRGRAARESRLSGGDADRAQAPATVPAPTPEAQPDRDIFPVAAPAASAPAPARRTDRFRRRERGQATIETVAIIPMALVIFILAFQLVGLGLSFVWAGHAANAAARALSVTGDQGAAVAAARKVVPSAIQGAMTVNASGNTVSVRVRTSVFGSGIEQVTIGSDADRRTVMEGP